ncbi:MAG TPA: class I adenylate-forming enzyme family protein [Myxococcota bacterium]|nr:class I adenylate-forming enzyme family protein [Myxococcota bacterium]
MDRAAEFPLHARIEAQLTGPGAPFEAVMGEVLGERMAVFRERTSSLRALLEGSAAFGDREYIVQADRRISFSEHLRTVASVAKTLRDRFGVRPGDRVAILAANCPEWIVSWWAAVSLGAIAVGMNGWWTGDEIRYALGDSEPTVLVGDAKRLERLRGQRVRPEVVEIERDFPALWNYDRSAPLPSEPIAEDDPACILYTSGTTGRPKGAVNTHRNIVALHRLYTFHGIRLLMIASAKGAGPPGTPVANCTLMTTPLFHLSGLYTGAVTLLASGVKTVWTKGRFDPVQVMQLIQSEQVTSWGPMGTMFHRVASHPDVAKYDLSSVRQVGSGGSPISASLQQRMRDLFPNARTSLGLGYGLTEATGMVTLNFGEELERHPDSVGAPLPTMEVEVRDADGKAVPNGTEGEVYLRGPLVMKEYWRNEAATRAAIVPGRWLRTGDWGRLEGGLLTINSRARDLILRGGENIYPAEIEQRLEVHPDVEESAVVGVDHVELGQEVKAIVVPKHGRALDPAELARFVGETLAYFKVPSVWEIRRERLPRNATGKVLKGVLVTGSESPFQEE